MEILAVLAVGFGVVLVAVALYDLLATTVAVSLGTGPVTHRLAQQVWRGFLALYERRPSHRLLAWGGPVILVVVVLTWLVLLVAGWSLVVSWPGALVTGETGTAPSALERVLVAGSLVVGRASPAIEPAGGLWLLVTQAAGLSGLVLLSLAIAYILPVVNAVVDSRQTASYIATLGHTPEAVLKRAWNGQDFGVLRLHLIALTAMINRLAEDHLAYPVIHYFHSVERHTALGPSIAVLDDTLTVLDACKQDGRLEPSTIVPLRAAITEFLDTLGRAFITPAVDVAPIPAIEDLSEQGLPLRRDDCLASFQRVAERRRLLRALLEHDGWSRQQLSQGSWEQAAILGREDTTSADDGESPGLEGRFGN